MTNKQVSKQVLAYLRQENILHGYNYGSSTLLLNGFLIRFNDETVELFYPNRTGATVGFSFPYVNPQSLIEKVSKYAVVAETMLKKRLRDYEPARIQYLAPKPVKRFSVNLPSISLSVNFSK